MQWQGRAHFHCPSPGADAHCPRAKPGPCLLLDSPQGEVLTPFMKTNRKTTFPDTRKRGEGPCQCARLHWDPARRFHSLGRLAAHPQQSACEPQGLLALPASSGAKTPPQRETTPQPPKAVAFWELPQEACRPQPLFCSSSQLSSPSPPRMPCSLGVFRECNKT